MNDEQQWENEGGQVKPEPVDDKEHGGEGHMPGSCADPYGCAYCHGGEHMEVSCDCPAQFCVCQP